MFEQVQPDPERYPSLYVKLGPPIADRPRSGLKPVPQAHSVMNVTLHGGIFKPNRQHPWVEQDIVRNPDLDSLSLVAGGLTRKQADTVLFDNGHTATAGRLTRLRSRLSQSDDDIEELPTIASLVGISFDRGLLAVTQAATGVSELAIDTKNNRGIKVIEAAARGLGEAETAIELQLSQPVVHLARATILLEWEVHNMEAAVTVAHLANRLQPRQEQ